MMGRRQNLLKKTSVRPFLMEKPCAKMNKPSKLTSKACPEKQKSQKGYAGHEQESKREIPPTVTFWFRYEFCSQ
jgi:hypothetical protein